MELFHVDDSNEVFSGFRIVRFRKIYDEFDEINDYK